MADNDSTIRQLFTLLESNVFYGDRLSSREFVTIMSPGQFLSPNLRDNNLNDAYEIFSATNDALAASFLRNPLAGSISGRFNDLLQFRALPKRALSHDEITQRDDAETWIESHREVWKKYKGVYDEFDRELSKELSKDSPDSATVMDLQNKRSEALDEWEHEGSAALMREHQGTYFYYTSGDPKEYWNTNIVKPFNDSKMRAPKGDFLRTFLDPQPKDWASASWTKLTLSVNDSFSSSYSRSTSWDAGGGFGFGLWHFGGDYGKSETYKHEHSDASNLSIVMEYLPVRIVRPWLTEDVFSQRFWTWNKVHGWIDISDGGSPDASPPVAPKGVRGLPFISKELFIVRNVQVSGNFSKSDQDFFNTHTQASAGFGWGPFSCKGSYTEDTTTRTATSHMQGGTLSIEFPQVLGLMGTLVPRCPDPDRSLPWEADAAFPEHMNADYRTLLRSTAADDELTRRVRREQRAHSLEIRASYDKQMRDLQEYSAERIRSLREALDDRSAAKPAPEEVHSASSGAQNGERASRHARP